MSRGVVDMPEPLLKFLSDYKVLCLVLGAAFLAVGLVGGGLTVKEIKIPSVSSVYRAMTILVGALLMGSGFLVSTESPSKEEAVQYQQQDYDTGTKYYLICSIAANDPDGGLVVRSSPGVLGEMGHEHMRVGRIPPDGRRPLSGKAVTGRSEILVPGNL